ncbi:MAG: hypothetical protein REI09_05725 [Candidatus Dactylopiibacterium sp.]|nr:hypothetical protein [Candidatus Dactylopiibacterium sp.]
MSSSASSDASTQATLYVGFAVSSNSNTAAVQVAFQGLTLVGGGLP